MNIKRTNSENKDFIELVKLLDADLAIKDGKDHSFYHQFNKIENIKYVVLAYLSDEVVGCGAIKEYETGVMEIKRMFVHPSHRGNGIATQVLFELEKWSAELGFHKCILETGINQPDAIRLYRKNNYQLISNYGQYGGLENSFCFEKKLR